MVTWYAVAAVDYERALETLPGAEIRIDPKLEPGDWYAVTGMVPPPRKTTTHRLVSSPSEIRSACRGSKPGDAIAANPFPLTCEACAALEPKNAE